MKQNAVCIFAHPDDESFGPSGTIHLLTKTYNVYIICITKGDAGENHHHDKTTPLETLRKQELLASSKIVGVKQVFFLGYPDGELNNNSYHVVAADVQKILDDLRPELLLTFEHRGVSGHLDHVAAAMITSYLYEKLSYVKEVMFYALRKDQVTHPPGEYFIFFPRGYDSDSLTLCNDVSSVIDVKRKAISQHISQSHDMKHILARLRTIECFYTFKKNLTPKASK